MMSFRQLPALTKRDKQTIALLCIRTIRPSTKPPAPIINRPTWAQMGSISRNFHLNNTRPHPNNTNSNNLLLNNTRSHPNNTNSSSLPLSNINPSTNSSSLLLSNINPSTNSSSLLLSNINPSTNSSSLPLSNISKKTNSPIRDNRNSRASRNTSNLCPSAFHPTIETS